MTKLHEVLWRKFQKKSRFILRVYGLEILMYVFKNVFNKYNLILN